MNILITKFPHTSVHGGGEEHTYTLVSYLQTQGISFFTLTSCKVLSKMFKEKAWHVRTLPILQEPVSIPTILLFPFVAPYIFCVLSFWFCIYKIKYKINKVYCLSLTEKILMTPIAHILGMQVIWMEHTNVKRWLTKNPLRILYKLFSRFVTIITVSEHVKQELVCMGIAKNRIKVIYNGIHVAKITKQCMEATLPHPNAPRAFHIGCVARLHKEKGLDFLVRAIAIVKENIPNIKVTIIGDGEEKNKLIWLAKNLGVSEHFTFVGYREDVGKWIAPLDVFVLPSVARESFGMAIVDAMTCSKPVIATKVGGIPEIVIDGYTGLLVKPKDYEGLAQAIIFMDGHRHLASTMGIRGRRRALTYFTLHSMLKQYYLLFTT